MLVLAVAAAVGIFLAAGLTGCETPGEVERAAVQPPLLPELQAKAALLPELPPNLVQPDVRLAWDPVTEKGFYAYRLYWGTNSRDYSSRLETEYTEKAMPPIAPGVTTYFAVTSVLTNGLESPFSAEVSYTLPKDEPPPPSPPLSNVVLWIAVEASKDLRAWREITNLSVRWPALGKQQEFFRPGRIRIAKEGEESVGGN